MPHFGLHEPESVPAPWRDPPVLDLSEVVGANAIRAIREVGRIVFHAAGDTGGVVQPERQLLVAAKMGDDFRVTPPPAFFFHLGDVVYFQGERENYRAQFDIPYADYPAPIFAIPGNHDGGTPPGAALPLEGFLEEFVEPRPDRKSPPQPGVYFALRAPFVTVIGLYSNKLDNPGVLSSEGGTYDIGDEQVDFLIAQLREAKARRAEGESAAIVLAVHHPPFSGDRDHGGSPGMLADLDKASTTADCWPDMILSGHAHIYQRFTRFVQKHEIPCLVAGMGGFAELHPLRRWPDGQRVETPARPYLRDGTLADHRLECYVENRWGYLRLTASAERLTCEFMATPLSGRFTEKAECLDRCAVDLRSTK